MNRIVRSQGATAKGDAVAEALTAFMALECLWEGSATELLKALDQIQSELGLFDRKWPSTPHELSRRLKLIAPDMRAVRDIDIRQGDEMRKSARREIAIEAGWQIAATSTPHERRIAVRLNTRKRHLRATEPRQRAGHRTEQLTISKAFLARTVLMDPAENNVPADNFGQRKGGALLCVGVMAAVQVIFSVTLLYFMSGQPYRSSVRSSTDPVWSSSGQNGAPPTSKSTN